MAEPLPAQFSQIFDAADFTHIVNSADEVGAILRGQQMAEEWLTFWIERRLKHTELLDGIRLDFPQRARLAQRLGLPESLGNALVKVNEIRNRLAHRKAYRVQESELHGLATLVDAVPSQAAHLPITQMRIQRSGKDASGVRREIDESYSEADSIRKFTLVIAMLATKTYESMQRAGIADDDNAAE